MILGLPKKKNTAAPSSVQPATAAAEPVPAPAPPPEAEKRMRPRDMRQLRLAQVFAQTVAVLMRDPAFSKLPLGVLEWRVLPPLMAGQFRLAHLQTHQQGNGQQPGMLVPVAVALWARLSPALDAAMSENPGQPARLQPGDWASGEHLWLMTAAGDPRAIPAFLKQLGQKEFKGQTVKLRTRGADGKVTITTLGEGA